MLPAAHRLPVKVAACQTPALFEDVAAALVLIKALTRRAEERGAQLVCFPECFLQGYLLDFESAQRNALDFESESFREILAQLTNLQPVLVVGLIEREAGFLYNTAAVISRGALLGKYRKHHLLQSERIFRAGTATPVFEVHGLRFGINICYDTQFPEAAAAIRDQRAHLIVCLANNLLPRATAEEWKHRHNEMRGARCRETGLWLVSSDVTGEARNLLGLGPTCVLDPQGSVVAQVPLNEVGLITFDIPPVTERTSSGR